MTLVGVLGAVCRFPLLFLLFPACDKMRASCSSFLQILRAKRKNTRLASCSFPRTGLPQSSLTFALGLASEDIVPTKEGKKEKGRLQQEEEEHTKTTSGFLPSLEMMMDYRDCALAAIWRGRQNHVRTSERGPCCAL